jgi:hypothetical protein
MRLAGVQTAEGFKIILQVTGAAGIDPAAKARIRKLTVEDLSC